MSLPDEEHDQRMEEDRIGDEDENRDVSNEGFKPDRPQEQEDEDEDGEDEDDEEDEEETSGRKKKRVKHRHKRPINRFLDIEAEVSDEEEEEEDEEEEGTDNFFTNADEPDDESTTRRNHALLNRNFATEDKSPEEIANAIVGRHRDRPAPYTGDMSEVPQRLLMPSVHDASLWQVRVKAGRERDIVFSLLRKAIDVEYTARPLSILSAFQRDSLPGMIYVEARSAKQVQQACQGLVGVYLSRGIHLVPIEEMASLLLIKKQDVSIKPGTWVRIRRGKYAGDLAQVMDLTENGEDVGVRLIPRIDMSPRDDLSLDPAARKRKKGPNATGTTRPPQRLFNFDEISRVYGKAITRRNQAYVFQGDTYRDGFLEKDFKVSGVILDDIKPTLDEITQFTRDDGGEDVSVNLSAIAEASRKAAIAVLQPGDHVEVFEGEQAGVHGVVEEVSGDVVTMVGQGVDIEGQKMEIPARSVRKKFKPGDHVKVMAGQHADETGLVVSVAENVVTFLSDMTIQEISVFAKDLRTAAEVGIGSNIVGDYELHDLVQLDAQTVGVIFKTERDSFRVLDQNGQVRLVQPHQISMRRDSSKAVATDAEGHELRFNDNVKEVDGAGRKGRVLHTHQSFFAFLHNREIAENSGVFVTRTRALASLAPKSNVLKNPNADLSKMNPAMVAPTGGMVGSGAMTRGPRDRDIGTTVMVVKGTHKGYVGTIRDTNGHIARVELRMGNKVIMIEKEKLYIRHPDGSLEPLVKSRGKGPGFMGPPQGGMSNPYANSGGFGPPIGSRTPFGAGRTPNPYIDGSKTPAWNASSRTPNPYGDGGKTPSWNEPSKTPNPYTSSDGGKTPGWGGRTPAWNASGSKTPNPYASGGNTATTNWGGTTPGRNAGWDNATPTRPEGGAGGSAGGWGIDDWGAPTPAVAATPGVHLAQTPAYIAATPGVSQTPIGVWSAATNAATPGGAMLPADHSRSGDEDAIDEEWLFDNILVNYLSRIKIVIRGTKTVQYLNGDYEGKTGRIVAAQKTPNSFEQTARVRFFDTEEERSFAVKFISPQEPKFSGEEVLVLDGKQKGMVLLVREKPDINEMIAVSSRQNPVDFDYVPKKMMVALTEEGR